MTFETHIVDQSEPLLPASASQKKTNDMVKKLALVFGSLVGGLVHFSTLGVHVWFKSMGFPLETNRIGWSMLSSVIVSTLVVLVYIVLTALADQLQSFQRITLALETRFVAGFICTLVILSTCYDAMILYYTMDGESSSLATCTVHVGSLVVLLCGYLSIRAYEMARLQEIAEEEEADEMIACSTS